MPNDTDHLGSRPDTGRRHLILGTAGHIDHGKTSLVKALTGTDTDRLPEERRRGMTIELGFAELSIGPVDFGIVDVPGHERFVRTMVAGATGIDLALIVIAGDDSVMPQTIEHLEVLRLVGIEHAVVAVTKVDLVEATLLDLVEEEVGDLLKGTPLEGSPMVRVSSVTSAGLDELRRLLVEAAHRGALRETKGPFRMAIDRVFTVQGRGTVVTGSVIRGRVKSGDALEIHPGQLRCRVRDLQSHGSAREALHLGQRAALNLIGVDRDRMDRGHELATPGYLSPSRRVDATFEALSTVPRALKPFSTCRICMGTREMAVRVVTLDRTAIQPGATAYVQLRSVDPMFAAYGQRYIARAENGSRTIGGGVILRPHAARWPQDRQAEQKALRTLQTGSVGERLTRVLIESGFDNLSGLELSARTGILPDELPQLLEAMEADHRRVALDGSDRYVVPGVIDTLFARADRRLERYHQAHPDEPGCHIDSLVGWLERKSAPGLGRPLFERYREQRRAQVRGRFVCLPQFAPAMSAQDERVYGAMLAAFREGLYQPPSVDQLAQRLDTDVKRVRRLVKVAVSLGELAEIDGKIYLWADYERRMRETVAEMIRESDGATVAAVRERLQSSRKYVVPLMEYLDRIKFTQRRGDLRVLHESQST